MLDKLPLLSEDYQLLLSNKLILSLIEILLGARKVINYD